ncbi:hypothetical protein BDV93DRAFT_607419 [Ceratobasidium sp. AG-I]|nr:hypothetical protein BDV93DRAFT_607419 [Ceratobasidium sp. AG-I]
MVLFTCSINDASLRRANRVQLMVALRHRCYKRKTPHHFRTRGSSPTTTDMSFPCKRRLCRRLKPAERFQRVVRRLKGTWLLMKNGIAYRGTKSRGEFKNTYEPKDEINEKNRETNATLMKDDIKKGADLGTDDMHTGILSQVDIARGVIPEEAIVSCDSGAQLPAPSPGDIHIVSGLNDNYIPAATNLVSLISAARVSNEFSGRTSPVFDMSSEPSATVTHKQSNVDLGSTCVGPVDFSASSDIGISGASGRFSTEVESIQSPILRCCDHVRCKETGHLGLEGGIPPDATVCFKGPNNMPSEQIIDLERTSSRNGEVRASSESSTRHTGCCMQSAENESAAHRALTPARSESESQTQAGHLIQADDATSLDGSSSVKGEKKFRKAAPLLPHELWIPIASFLLSMSSSILDPYMLSASKWADIAGLAGVSRYHRRTVLRFWVTTLLLKNTSDIAFLKQLGATNQFEALTLVKSILCYDSYQVYSARQKVLLGFINVEELVLDAHSDIHFREAIAWPDADDADEPAVARPRMSYKNLWVKFPSSLKVLRLFHGHCPDIAIIRKAASDCPQLEVLTLGRCTMFTQGCCQFWAHLPPEEHDAYFSNTDVEDYAEAVGKELCKLTCLKVVHIHVYLTPFAAVEEHLRHCSQEVSTGLGDPSCWRDACPKCAEEYQAATLATEKIASEILSSHVPSIQQVSWASFFSPRRTGWSTHYVK